MQLQRPGLSETKGYACREEPEEVCSNLSSELAGSLMNIALETAWLIYTLE